MHGLGIAGVMTGTVALLSQRLVMAVLVTAVFTALARWIRGVSRTGAVAGALICFVLYLGAGAGAFLALVSVFALTWITTHLGYQQKQRLGTAEKKGGRTASQVVANLGVAAACAGVYAVSGRPAFLLAVAATLAEAAADTVSSELGQTTSDKARLITTWEEVPAGTDGGITATGTLCGIAAAAAVSAVCTLSRLVPWRWFAVALTAAVVGMLADSFLGAWLERRQVLSNDAVNFLSTLVAAAGAVAMQFLV